VYYFGMARRFLMSELRTLVARGLQEGSYSPAVSARVRAVPDTRTIRYYTTLGMIRPPVEMRGRVAYYDENHVLQIVAIKQLQAQNLTLSEIQQQLVGLTPRKLASIAKLPTDFWDAADRYLASLSTSTTTDDDRNALETETIVAQQHSADSIEAPTEFWLEPAALPAPVQRGASEEAAKKETTEVGSVRDVNVIRIELPGGWRITIEPPKGFSKNQKVDLSSILMAAQPIYEELSKQKLTDQ
jgi:DNA-binding transcriptional MerR regulator